MLSVGNGDTRFDHIHMDERSADLGLPTGLAHSHFENGFSFVACAWAYYGEYNNVSVHLFDEAQDPSPRFVIPETTQFTYPSSITFTDYSNGTLRYTQWSEGYSDAPVGEWLVEGKRISIRQDSALDVQNGTILWVKHQPFVVAPSVRDLKAQDGRWVPVYP